MASHTSAELVILDCSPDEGGLNEFLPEAQRDGQLWLRAPSPSAADVLRWEPYVVRAHSRSWTLVLPVVIAAAIVGGVLSWAGVGARARPVPAVPDAAPVVAAAEADVAVAAPVPEAVVEIAAPVARVNQVAAPVSAPLPVDPKVERTLAAVSQSYRTLDAAALAGVWPGADTAALAERFSALKYQSLTFDRCQVKPNGTAGAVASCEVSIAQAPKVGEPTLQRRREAWTLVLDRSSDRWTITGVSVR